jgi:hypothetical protein
MTPSQRRRASRLFVIALAVASLFALGCRHHGQHGEHHGNHGKGKRGFQSEAWDVEIISAKIGGKNVFIPSTLVVAGDRKATLTIYNTTDTPHGFAIDELGIREVIHSQKETPIELPDLEGHRVLKIYCHLHPPHRSATLVVLPGPH